MTVRSSLLYYKTKLIRALLLLLFQSKGPTFRRLLLLILILNVRMPVQYVLLLYYYQVY